MTATKGHLRTDGKIISPCCSEADTFMANDRLRRREGKCSEVHLNEKGQITYCPGANTKTFMQAWTINYCPFCGSKLEHVEKLDQNDMYW